MSQQDPRLFITQHVGGGTYISGQTSAGAIFGPIIMVIAAPFLAAHWVVDRFGWQGLIALLVALVAIIWWMFATRIGRVVAGGIGVFLLSFITTFIVGGIGVAIWSFTS